MRRAEQLHEEILAQMDLSKEASDEELLELIRSNEIRIVLRISFSGDCREYICGKTVLLASENLKCSP